MDTLAILNTVFLGLSTLAVVVLVAVGVFAFLEFRKTMRAVQPIAEAAKESLPSAITEANRTLKSLRDVTNEAITIMQDIKETVVAGRAIADNVKRVSESTKRFTQDVEGITSAISGRISGVQAGVRVALSVIEKGLRNK
jgi:uncharacterized protein YoxC